MFNSKKKNFASLIAITTMYLLFSVATSKYTELPDSKCLNFSMKLLSKHDSLLGYAEVYKPLDTFWVFAQKDSGWVNTSQQICKVYKDSCNISNIIFMVINPTAPASTWDNRRGKLIYSTTCP